MSLKVPSTGVPKPFHISNFFFLKGTCLAPAAALRDPNEDNKGNFESRLSALLNIPSPNICETRLYFKFNATNRMSWNNLWVDIFGPKVGKVAFFSKFFLFFDYNCRNINDRRKILLKWRDDDLTLHFNSPNSVRKFFLVTDHLK